MKVTMEKDGKTFVVTSKVQMDAFKAEGYTEVEEVTEEPKKVTPKRKVED